MADAPALRVEDVHKRYGDVHAVRGISFEVRAGEVFGLLGPNGAGKTTLIRMVLDIQRPDSGRVAVFGHALTRGDLDAIGYLPEERGLYRRQTAGQVLAYLGQLKGRSAAQARDEARRWLSRLGIEGHLDRRIETLSKGNQQKIQLIATLVGRPKLLVWDEPFSGLDPVNVTQVVGLLEALKAEGLAVILSTHRMSQAEALCDRVGLVSRGRMVVQGAVHDVLEAHGAGAWEVQTDGDPAAAGAEVERVVGAPGAWPRYVVRPPEGRGDLLVERLVAAGARIGGLKALRPSLEEVFLRVAGAPADGEPA